MTERTKIGIRLETPEHTKVMTVHAGIYEALKERCAPYDVELILARSLNLIIEEILSGNIVFAKEKMN